ncbi:MAG: MlaD family protein [Vampirovibrionales bacterium]
MHKQHRTATVKVGLLTIIALVVLTSTVIWLRGRSLGGEVRYEVIFNDVDGLRKGAPVQFMGIRVGYIEDIKVIEHRGGPRQQNGRRQWCPLPNTVVPSDFEVKVVFGINRADVIPPKGSVVSVEQSGIIGEKFLEILPPDPSIPI